MDLFFRTTTLVIGICWLIYWLITAHKAYAQKPRISQKKNFLDRYVMRTLGIPVLVQLLGIKILPIVYNSDLQIAGFLIFLLGISISVSGRIALGTNWANAHEYQIKQNQTLVTNGIYKYIRHPIYAALLFVWTGAELVCQSYLFIIALIGILIWSYSRAKREEVLLEKHFGKEYIDYKTKTKMLIPFVW